MNKDYKFRIDRATRRKVGYYSTPPFIAEFIATEMITLNPNGKRALDPAIGSEELLKIFHEKKIPSDGYDIVVYKGDYICQFHNKNFLKEYVMNRESLVKQEYDFIIVNPPFINYKNIDSLEYQQFLKDNFPKSFTNTFADYLHAVIGIAKDGCVIGAVLPDSLLYSKSYSELRNQILKECYLTHIVLCPESTFHGTGANLSACLLIMIKSKGTSKYIKVLDRLASIEEFKDKLTNRDFEERNIEELIVNNGEDSIISVSITEELKDIIVNSHKLGNQYIVSGGVSTGIESLFTSVEKKEGYTIPYFTNPASSKFQSEPNCWLRDDFMEIGKTTKGFIARNKRLYNKEGIVCSATGKRFSVCYLPAKGVVRTNASIFPPVEDLYWLLAYLNSSLVTYILKGILARSNLTTIGNVASIPLPDFPDNIKQVLSGIALEVISGKLTVELAVEKIDSIIETQFKLSDETKNNIHHFCTDLTHLV